MEILLIFIIMMVISSILRSWRGTGTGRSYSPAPSGRQESGSLPDFWEITDATDFAAPEDSPEERPFERYFPGERDYLQGYQGPEVASSARRKQRPPVPPAAQPKEALSAMVSYRPSGVVDLERHLRELLETERLPAGILAAEIFAPPRARRPFRRNMR